MTNDHFSIGSTLNMSRRLIFLLTFFFVSVTLCTRFLPHAANATALGALALFAGVYLPRRWAIVVPLAVLLLSDAWLGGYELPVMLSVYGSFAVITGMGVWLRQSSPVVRSIIGPIASATFFFLVTNFAVWAATPLYVKNGAGLLHAYLMAIPFWRNMLVGDILYASLFFGIAVVIQNIHFKNKAVTAIVS